MGVQGVCARIAVRLAEALGWVWYPSAFAELVGGMKFIFQGKAKPKAVRVTCIHCDSVIEFQPSEIRTFSDVRNDSYMHLECPACGQWSTTEVREVRDA